MQLCEPGHTRIFVAAEWGRPGRRGRSNFCCISRWRQVNGRLVAIDDGVKNLKSGKTMPEVIKRLHQEFESNSKPEHIFATAVNAADFAKYS